VLRRPLESARYTSADYTQTLDDHRVLASIGSVGDCYDNALAESFVDSYKTELIADRVWRTRSQLELATVEYIAWFNHDRLHEALGDIPPVEYEQLHALELALESPISDNQSVAALSLKAADGLRTRQLEPAGVDFVADGLVLAENALVLQPPGPAQAAREVVKRPTALAGLSDP
jgi:putative transposase